MKVLVVDDDRDIRELVAEIIFDGCGGTVVMGVNGEDGWREFQESRPDLVITDCRMETENAGLELARKIKAASPTTPVIMITGEWEIEAETVDYFLPKPFKVEVLVEKIKEFLEKERR